MLLSLLYRRITRLRSHHHAAVNVETLTSDVCGRRIEGEELHEARYFVGLTITPERDGGEDLRLDLGTKLGSHV